VSLTVLHERKSQDLHVQLIWHSVADYIYVKVRDLKTRDFFLVEPDRAEALDAFYHPFCYAPAAETDRELLVRAEA
jgi:hypothetical protein